MIYRKKEMNKFFHNTFISSFDTYTHKGRKKKQIHFKLACALLHVNNDFLDTQLISWSWFNSILPSKRTVKNG